MPAPVVIDFILRGMPDVTRAFRTVEQAAAASARSQTTSAQRAMRERQSIVDREARDKVRAMLKVDRDVQRIQERAARDAAKAAQQRTRAEQREMQQMVREAEKAANARLRIEQRVDREMAAMRRRQERDRERVVRADERRSEQEARKKASIAAKDANREMASRETFRRGIGQGVVSGVTKGAGAVVSGARATAGMFAQLGGGFSIADSVARQGALERNAIALSNSAYIPGQNQRLDPKAIMAQSKIASAETGMDAGDLIEATKAYVAKSADVKGGMENMGFFGQIAKATDTSAQDVAKTAGILRVQNKNLGPEEMKQMLLDVIMQGKQGSVEFEDLAKVAGKVTRSSAAYGGNQADNQRKLLGLSQIAIRTAGNPNEAATVLSNISSDAAGHSKDIKAVLGEGAFNERGQIAKGPDEFIADVMEKTGGNLMKIQGMGFGQRSMKMFQALAPTFNEAADAAGGTPEQRAKAGRAAITQDMGQIIGAKYSQENLGEDLKRVLAGGSEQMEKAMRELRTAVGEQLAPEMLKLVPVLRDSIPALQRLLSSFVSMAEWASQNPFKAIFAIITASIAKEAASAAMGQAIGKALETSLGQKGGLVMASGAIAVTTASIIVETIATQQAAQVSRDVASSGTAFAQAAGVRTGDKTTDVDLQNLISQRDEMKSKVEQQRSGVNTKEAIEYVGMLGKAAAITPVGYLARKASGDEGVFKDMDQSEAYQRSRQQRLEQSEQALDKLNKAIEIASGNLKNLGKDGAGGAGGAAPGGTSGAGGTARGTGIGQRTQ